MLGQNCCAVRDVSILARTKARALPNSVDGLLVGRNVSILARTKARALPVSPYAPEPRVMFQSSPAPRRGRYMGGDVIQRAYAVSILARTKARALHTHQHAGRGDQFVSILARTKARALQFASNVMSNNV